MSKQPKSKWYGKSAASDVVAALRSGSIDSLVMATGDATTLSQMSRELVRSLRDIGARVEFYQKSDAEAAIHAANKLLADVPVDQLTLAKSDEAPRLLLIDGAEQLEESELTALQRLSRALRGSSYRAVYFLKADGESGLAESLQQLLVGTPVWWIDETAPLDTRVVASESSVQGSPVQTEARSSQRLEEPRPETPSAEITSGDREDVLTALAAERARERGFDATTRPWWTVYGKAVAMLAAVALLVTGGWYVQTQLTSDDRLRVYDCGVYADEATLDVVRERLGRTVPTRILREQDKWRLQVGPFAGASEADRHLSQIWGIGPCRVNPSILQNTKKG